MADSGPPCHYLITRVYCTEVGPSVHLHYPSLHRSSLTPGPARRPVPLFRRSSGTNLFIVLTPSCRVAVLRSPVSVKCAGISRPVQWISPVYDRSIQCKLGRARQSHLCVHRRFTSYLIPRFFYVRGIQSSTLLSGIIIMFCDTELSLPS